MCKINILCVIRTGNYHRKSGSILSLWKGTIQVGIYTDFVRGHGTACFEAAIGPEVAAENRAASCALGTGKARWDGALDDAAR